MVLPVWKRSQMRFYLFFLFFKFSFRYFNRSFVNLAFFLVVLQVWLLTKLAFLLIRCMGAGSEWIIRCTRLAIFSLILLPCFLRHFWFYFTSSHILKNVSYGRNSRNSLDLYIPFRRHQSDDTPKKWPVLICFSGGAWIIGYKAWSGLVGKMMMEHGILLVTPDYRNFPQGLVSDMLEDYNAAIRWVFQNIDAYGGDVDNIYIMGQSAGAHLSALALIDNAERQLFLHPSNGDSHLHLPHSWRVSDVKAYIGVSGVYDLPKATAHIHDRGLYKSVLFSIMEGELSLHSPSLRVERMKRRWQSRRALQRMQQ
ncbi:putative isoprenylcysteine alpha-carbonyl methylesterase ICMEL1, variant 2, partial [Balamuthia mandrillaris]